MSARRRLAVVVAIAAALTAPAAPAAAGSDLVSPANAAPARHTGAEGLFRQAVAVADRRWRSMGQAPCSPVRVGVYDAAPAAAPATFTGVVAVDAGLGEVATSVLGGCAVWIDRGELDALWQIYRFTPFPYTGLDRRAALADLCAIAVHERGHNLGLEHIPGTVMDASYSGQPAACRAWAQRLVPSRWPS